MDNYDQLVEDCETRESRMSDWEISFIGNIRDKIDREFSLSPKEKRIIEGIWEKVTEAG